MSTPNERYIENLTREQTKKLVAIALGYLDITDIIEVMRSVLKADDLEAIGCEFIIDLEENKK